MKQLFGARLEEERKKLRLNQADFAELGGMKPRAYWNYEQGKVAPDAEFLARLCENGVDVLYVITGQRQIDLAQGPDLRDTYLSPSRRLAGEIAGMNLTNDDAELLLAFARRLCPPG